VAARCAFTIVYVHFVAIAVVVIFVFTTDNERNVYCVKEVQFAFTRNDDTDVAIVTGRGFVLIIE
jgi:hypothetical protein